MPCFLSTNIAMSTESALHVYLLCLLHVFDLCLQLCLCHVSNAAHLEHNHHLHCANASCLFDGCPLVCEPEYPIWQGCSLSTPELQPTLYSTEKLLHLSVRAVCQVIAWRQISPNRSLGSRCLSQEVESNGVVGLQHPACPQTGGANLFATSASASDGRRCPWNMRNHESVHRFVL